MRPENRLRFIRDILYRLKRDYGSLADIYHQSSETIDLDTGRKVVTKSKISIRKTILLPNSVSIDSTYGTTYTNSDRKFVYGGFYSVGERGVIIDRKDLPKGYDLHDDHMNKYVIIQVRRYEIVEIQEMDNQSGYYIRLKELEGAQLAQTVEMKMADTIFVDTESEGEL